MSGRCGSLMTDLSDSIWRGQHTSPLGGGVVRLMLDGLVLNTSFWQCLSPFTLHIRSHLWWSWRRKRRHQVTCGLLWCSEATNRNTWFNPKAWQRRRIRLWGETLERKEWRTSMWSYLGSGLLVVISAAGLALTVITLAGSLCCGCEQVTLLSQGLPTQECK